MPSQDAIEFSAKYRGWSASKVIPIPEGSSPEEIVKQISELRTAVDRKAFEILNIDTKSLDAYAASVSKGKKGVSGLSEAFREIGSKEGSGIILKACGEKPELEKVASSYLIRCISSNLGFDFYLSGKRK
ncbi:MAG: DUF2666 family protein [Candidatus Micrarchaeota archaeon]|nr:DUF2666 family protein [Candidatus Micrarchaeota archaeon]